MLPPLRLLCVLAGSLSPWLLAACVTTGAKEVWDGEVRVHGTLREAMRGPGPGVVSLDVAAGANAWGLGLLEGAAGEVLVLDGEVLVARAFAVEAPGGGDALEVEVKAARGEAASWLAVARVPSWRSVVLERELDLAALAGEVARLAAEEGWDLARPLPFRVEGPFAALSLHVLRGVCPLVGPTPATMPFEATIRDAPSVHLIGLHAPAAAGLLVHHGEALHAHALLVAPAGGAPAPLLGHVDAARTAPGAVLSVPARVR